MQYQPFLPEVASGTIDPRAVVVPLRPRAEARHGRGRRGHGDRSRGASRARSRIPDGAEVSAGLRRPRRDGGLVVARPARPRPGRARDRVQDGAGGDLPPQPRALPAGRGVRRPRMRSVGARRSRSSSSAPDTRAWRRWASSRTWRATRCGTTRRCAPRDMRWVLVEAAGRILPELPEDLAALRAGPARNVATSRSCWTRGSSRRRAARSGCRTGRRSRPTRWSGQRG